MSDEWVSRPGFRPLTEPELVEFLRVDQERFRRWAAGAQDDELAEMVKAHEKARRDEEREK